MNNLEITDKTFDQKVLNSKKPVLVMFWGSWCPACKASQRLLNEIEPTMNNVNIYTINIDKNIEYVKLYDIALTPTFVLFNNGILQKSAFGSMSEMQLKQFMDLSK